MRVLLGSGGFRTPERIALLRERMRAFFGSIPELLFIPHALEGHDGYVRMMYERGLDAGYRLAGLHTFPDPIAAVEQAQGVFVGGGNSFRLLNEMHRLGLLPVIRERARRGLPYLGVSAGCNLACPTIRTTNDMPIVSPPSLDGLGLVPFQVNPHYFHGSHFVKEGDTFVEHFGETRDERLREYHQHHALPVVGLPEGGVLECQRGAVTLVGTPARVFQAGQPPVDVEAGAELSAWLTPVAYSVFVTFSAAEVAEAWKQWMTGGHLADVLAAGALTAELADLGELSFEARYRFASREAFTRYERDHAPRLRAEGLSLFPVEKGVSYRRALATLRG
jgi:dipeptidase E